MKLLEPFQFGSLLVKNRVVMAPMGSGYAEIDGAVSDRLVAYYARRAAGGVGMIVLENNLVEDVTTGVGPELCLYDDRFIAGQARLVAALHGHGCHVGAQLNHPGRQTKGGQPIGPSPIPVAARGPIPKALSENEIESVIESYVSAAVRARAAGHDFVELHAAHGYLACSFLSPLSNHRTDRWGGTLENRARFVLEIVRRIRRRLGESFPVSCRISGSEFVDGGLTITDSVAIARLLEAEGVSAISVSGGNWQSLHYIMMPMFMPEGAMVPMAAEVKAAVRIPVIAVGRLNDPALAEQVLQENKADAVAIGRGLIADPDWVARVQAGEPERIRPCIACNCCVDRLSLEKEVWCAVNPTCGFETEFEALTAAMEPRHVVVVGAGPAGCIAAEVARLKGHQVTLLERSDQLGGKLHIASYPPGKAVLAEFAGYMSRTLTDLGVKICLGTEATPDFVRSLHPDLVVLATGSLPLVPRLSGMEQVEWSTADAVLAGASVGRRVAIVGGSATGCETAEFLLERGHSVALLEMTGLLGSGMEQIARRFVFKKLKSAGAEVLLNSKVTGFQPGRVEFSNLTSDESGAIPIDTVVLALGYRPDTRLSDALPPGSLSCPLIHVGDAQRPGNIAEAVRDAADKMMSL